MTETNRQKPDTSVLAGFIDHTLLKADAAERDVLRLCDEAIQYGFASVCINPVFVPLAAEKLAGTKTAVCTVVGFPLGASATEIKAAEARLAVQQGAGEIDMVIQLGYLHTQKDDGVFGDIHEVVKNVKNINSGVIVKTIIETCYLTDEEKIRACRLAEKAGADFVKTSTGFGPGGATLMDVRLMKKAVSPHIGVKASGGIRTAQQFIEFIEAGATRIGTSSGINILHELSALK